MRNLIPSYVRVPVIFFAIAGLVEYFVDSGDKPAFIEQPIILLFLLLVLLVLIAIEGIVSSMDNILYQSLDEEGKKRYLASKSKAPEFKKVKALYSKLVGKQKAIEEESEIILDHNYDGIKELDNNLPPWWIYSFYISIVFAVIYGIRYHVLNGNDQFEEYEIEYAEANAAIEEYKKTAKGLVDFNTVELLTETSDLNSGKKIFEANCVACHKADGGGGIGPNLTDQHWILGGGIKNVFKTISEGGRDGKGMVSWKSELKPLEMAQVASYVLNFQGTIPAEPKAPEGDIWVDDSVKAEDSSETPATETEEVTETTEINTVASN
ncbi:c-type cytochrome [Winogradskyella litoriviva]|uniref:C-type cytochrome n=1 Tax=Winogradskyella litoriviva TaxID=1220182 RepID=A0ABX2E6J3_9FLAO|nr:cbb3-type cytochrome c oxidase N-terminal domain-containing protein [Winogradskyella litoriviva]NRD23949.1 c-type cytochrome [Winogradskyella litoriviva]